MSEEKSAGQDRSESVPAGDEPGRWEKIILGAIMAPFTAVTMGVAGALVTAIVVALISGGAEKLNGAVVTLLFGVLVKGVGFGLIAALVIGVVTLVVDKDSIFAATGTGGLLAFLGYGLWTIFVTALEIHVIGGWIGAGLGAVLGFAIGVAMARDDTKPEKLRAASRHRRTAPGTHPGELEWWRGDLDEIDGGDD